jgi:uncharacterized protein YndB with AHSA1/START domain
MTSSSDKQPEPRSAEARVEVPGTPEEVWQAIATGPGLSAWFVPAEIEGREGGTVTMDFGGGMAPAGTVTAWEPPHRYVGEEAWGAGRVATEYLVEARSGGTCVVRIVASLFGAGEDWEHELGSMQEGWSIFLQNLRLYLTHFAGEPSTTVMLHRAAAASSKAAAWAELAGALGLSGAAVGQRAEARVAGASPLSGQVEWVVDGSYHDGLMLRLDRPAPGTALVFVNAWRDTVHANLHAHLYGAEAAAVAAGEEPAWRAWMDERFPAPIVGG